MSQKRLTVVAGQKEAKERTKRMRRERGRPTTENGIGAGGVAEENEKQGRYQLHLTPTASRAGAGGSRR